MPTIEIVSVNAKALNLRQGDFNLTILEEDKLESHRGLFYHYLLKQQGTIIHIGNPSIKYNESEGYFAGDIVDWSFDLDTNFQFKQEFKDDIKRILEKAMDKSPENKIYFLTDYQFGPDKEVFDGFTDLAKLWGAHDSEGLLLNALYEVEG